MTDPNPPAGQPRDCGLPVEEFLRRYPTLLADPDLLLALIDHEIVCRERHGEQPRFDEYCDRFPHLAEQLPALFENRLGAGRPIPPPASLPPESAPAETVTHAQQTGSYHADGQPGDAAVWYYARGREKQGPVTWEQLRQMAADGTLRPEAMLWEQGTPRWLPAHSVAGLFDPAATPPRKGKKVPLPAVRGYEVLGVLGQGGMGVVYKARQVGLNRVVALKMIRAGALAGADALDRFRREAEAVARLQHPHIVQVHEVGEHDGLPYFSLEFVAGGSLADRLKGTPQPAQAAAQLVETLAGAVHAAHQKGVIHRDLKPGNVLLAEDGTPKVTDFGLAKQLDDDSGRTREGDVMGTPSYMAPEQAAGDLRAIGPGTDVYALGAILYECLTGRPPFRGATLLETLEQVRHKDPVPPCHLQPKVPRDLEIICLKCLQKEPARRYATAAALADDVRRYLDGRPILARPVGFVERAVKWTRRRPAVAALLALVVLVGSAGLGGILWNWREAVAALGREQEALGKEKEAHEEARHAQTAAERAAAETRRKNEQLERQAYATHIVTAARALAANDVTLAEDHLRACKPALRHWEWHYLRRQCQGELFTLTGGRGVAVSADGKRLVTASGADLQFYHTDTGREAGALAGAMNEGLSFVVSPDGRRVAVFAAKQVQVRDLATGKLLRTFAGFRTPVLTAAFSPDGARLAVAGGVSAGAGELKLLDADSGQLLHDVKEIGAAVWHVCFSPDGKRLASGGEDAVVRLWDTDRTAMPPERFGKQLQTFRGHEGPVAAVAFSPDGLFLASGGTDRTVRIWPLRGDVTAVCRGHAADVTALAFSADGKRVASAGQDKTVRLWDVFGNELAVYRGHREPIAALAFTPDGARLVTATARDVKVWDATRPPASLPPVNLVFASAVAFSRDGRLLAAGNIGGAVWVWDRATGRRLPLAAEQPGIDRGVSGLAFHPDGKELAAATLDGSVTVWEASMSTAGRQAGGRRLRAFSLKTEVKGLAYSGDGSRLAVHAGDRVRLLDAATGQEQFSWPAHPFAAGLAFSPDGGRLAFGGADQHAEQAQIVDLASHRQVALLRGHSSAVNGLSWQGDQLATISLDGAVKVWAVGSDQATARFTLRDAPTTHVAVAFSPDGQRLVSVTDRECKLWELAEGKELLSLPVAGTGWPATAFSPDGRCLAASTLRGPEILDGGPGPQVFSLQPRLSAASYPGVAWSPDGRLLARSGTAQIFLWDAVTGEELPPLPPAPAQVYGLAFSPDGRLLAAAGGDPVGLGKPGVVTVWDVARRQEVLAFREHASLVMGVAFSPDGRRLASCGHDGSIKVWDADTGKVEHVLQARGRSVSMVRFSPDGARLVAQSGGKVTVWDPVGGRQLYVCGAAEPKPFFYDAVFSPDGRYLVTAGAAAVRVWNAATGADPAAGRRVLPFGRVVSLAFSGDGQYLAGVLFSKGEAVVWDFASGQEVLAYPAAINDVLGLGFSPEGAAGGRRLAVAEAEVVNVWDAGAQAQAAAAERRRQEQAWLGVWRQR